MSEKSNVSGIGNLYNMNKSLVAQLPALKDFSNAKRLIDNFGKRTNNEFYMLYGKEISYFTLFHERPSNKSLGNCVINLIKESWDIYSVEGTDDRQAIEIWINDAGNPVVMYLFPYDAGVVEVE